MTDEYWTIAAMSEGLFSDRGSKFIAYAFPVNSEVEGHQILQSIKKDHPKARHFCTAIRLFPDASLERSNDDGEPTGSAGRPILGQLLRSNLTNVMVIVVRYFGGSKLGIPGLIEAYKTSTANAIENAEIIRRQLFSKVKLTMSYEQFPQFLNLIKQHPVPIFEESFNEKPTIILGFRKSTMNDDLMSIFHSYSQLDFPTVKQYADQLNMEIEFLADDVIL